MINKTNILPNFKNNKIKLFLLICSIPIAGCTKTGNTHDDQETVNDLEAHLPAANGFFPTAERSAARDTIMIDAAELTSEDIIKNPKALTDIIGMDDTKYLNSLLLKGGKLKEGLTANTLIGGTPLMTHFLNRVLGATGSKTNTNLNSSTRHEARIILSACLKDIEPTDPSLFGYAFTTVKGNWAAATEQFINRMDKTNTNCNATLKLIPLIVSKQSEAGAATSNFFGKSKDKRWNKTFDMIISKNDSTNIETSVDVHKGLLDGIKNNWTNLPKMLSDKLSSGKNPLPSVMIPQYQTVFADEIIKKEKYKDYKTVKTYMQNKLGTASCSPKIVAAALELRKKEGDSIVKEIFSTKGVNFNAILIDKATYGDSVNLISFAAKNFYNKSCFEDFMRQLHENMESTGKGQEFYTAVNNAFDQIAKRSGEFLAKDYKDVFLIIKNYLAPAPKK